MSPKGGKKAQKAAKTLRTSPLAEPLNLPARSPLDDGMRTQMFNLSSSLGMTAPLRRRSGGAPLSAGLPERIPKRRKTKESSPSAGERQRASNVGIRLEQALDDSHRQIMSERTPLKERTEEQSAKGDNIEECGKGAVDESAKGANEESAKGAGHEESDKGSNDDKGKGAKEDSAPPYDKWAVFEESPRGQPPKWGDREDDEEGITTDEQESVNSLGGHTPNSEGTATPLAIMGSVVSDKGFGNNEVTAQAFDNLASTREEINPPSQESSSVSIADQSAKAMTQLMWQEHPSMQARVPPPKQSGPDLTSVNRNEATPEQVALFKEFLAAKLQAKPHEVVLPPFGPCCYEWR